MDVSLKNIRDFWVRTSQSGRGRALTRLVRWLFLAGILAYLAIQLGRIGWIEIWRALPTNPLFYVLFLMIYFSLPLAEQLIYRITWRFPFRSSLPAFIKKRIYNKEVIGYSGEVYFFTWARRNLTLGDREILKTIRDNNVISSFSSTIVALALLAVFAYEGNIGVSDWIGDANAYYLAGGAVVFLILGTLAIRFRRYLFSMPLKVAFLIGGIHVIRLGVGQTMQILQWEVAVPDVTWQAWFTLAAVSIVVSRIPLVPNRDLIFIGAGVEFSHFMNTPAAEIASMLLVTSVLGKILNLVLFGAVSMRRDGTRTGVNRGAPSHDPASAEGPDAEPARPEHRATEPLAV